MARGDFVLFEEFANQLGGELHNLEVGQDTFKLGLVDENAPVPVAASADPKWATFQVNEVDSVAGNYAADGYTLIATAFDEVDGVATFDATDVAIAQDGSGFTNAYWGILYNDDDANDAAIGFLDMGGPVSEVAGPVAVAWDAAGIFTVTITP